MVRKGKKGREMPRWSILTSNQREDAAWGRWLEAAGAQQGQECAAMYVPTSTRQEKSCKSVRFTATALIQNVRT